MSLIVDNNKIIETPIIDILNSLSQHLRALKINKLKSIEVKNQNIRITCPIHKNGNEDKPSCEVLHIDKIKSNGKKILAGTVHCFSCGYRASFIKFISDCLQVSYMKATEWLLNVSSYSLLESTREVDFLDDLNCKLSQKSKLPLVSLDELKKYEYIHDYMFKRKLTIDIINKFDVGYDPDLDAITFPVYVNSECLFVAKRRVKYKWFDMPEIEPKPIYGLDYLTSNEVIVCESVINALTCYVYGKEAVALFGLGSDYQIDLLKKIKQSKIIIAFDGDTPGKKAALKIKKALTDKIVTILELPKRRDINDLTKEEFDNLEESYF